MTDAVRRLQRVSTMFELRHASTDYPIIVVAPERRFFAIDGGGHPGGADFLFATEVLRRVDDTFRASLRRAHVPEPLRSVLEVFWHIPPELPLERIADEFATRKSWHWQQAIELPANFDESFGYEAIDAARREAGRALPLVALVRFDEGTAAQVLHVAERGTETDAVRTLLEFVLAQSLTPSGPLHQLLLTNPATTSPARRRSIFRVAVRDAADSMAGPAEA